MFIGSKDECPTIKKCAVRYTIETRVFKKNFYLLAYL